MPRSHNARRLISLLIGAASLGLVSWADYATGAEVSMLALYLVPVAIAVFGVNFGGGLVAALLSGVSIYWARADAPMFAHRHGVLAWDAAMCVVTLAVAAFGIDAFKETFGFLVADDYV